MRICRYFQVFKGIDEFTWIHKGSQGLIKVTRNCRESQGNCEDS